MKKNAFLFLVSSLLISCGTPTISPDSSSDNAFDAGTSSLPDTQDSTTSENSKTEVTSKEVPEEPIIIDVTFPTNKSAVDLSTNSKMFEEVKACFGEHLTSMEVSKVFADEGGIRLASSSVDGVWTLEFDISIKSVSISAKPYMKNHYDDKTWYVDALDLSVNNDQLAKVDAYTSTDEPENPYKTYTVNLTETANKLVFNNVCNCRSLIQSMQLVSA